MIGKRLASFVILVAGGLAFAEAATTAPRPVEELVKAGQWKEGVAAINRQLEGKPAPGVDRVALLKLRAECQLQLKEDSAALGSLELIRQQAVKNAAKADEEWANAFTLLLKRKSAGYVYVPRTAEVKAPIDILDKAKREEAYKALLVDEVAVYKETVKKTAGGQSILPILDLADNLGLVRGLEKVVTGNTKETDTLAKELTDTASKLITQAEDDFNQRIAAISAESNQGRPRRRNGIDGNDEAELSKIHMDCDRIIATVHKLRTLTGREETLENALSRAERLRERADAVSTGQRDPRKTLPQPTKDKKEP